MFKHPKGLYVLFMTEMWERFSFYGMKALLIFYLTKYHFFSDDASSDLIGNYAALVYALPVIGGLLADRFLGSKKAILFGGILIVIGQFGLLYSGNPAYLKGSEIIQDLTALQFFYLSLAVIIMGVGFLKPNISTVVGSLYEENDPRRDSGFTIFYMGINLGAALSTIICGEVGERFGWNYGFGLAGIGMIIGLVFFTVFKKYLKGYGEPPVLSKLKEKVFLGLNKEVIIYLGAILGIGVVWQLVQFQQIVGWTLIITSVVIIAYITWVIIVDCNKDERGKMMVLLVLMFSAVVFFALLEQQFISLNLFTDRLVDRNVLGYTFKASSFLSLNSIYIILLAPVIAWAWIRLAAKKLEPSTPVKFSLGIILAGLSYGILVLGCKMGFDTGKVAVIYLILSYGVLTIGEVFVSPVGLSAVTKLAIPKVVGVMMGTWFLATAASEYLAAVLSKIASIKTVEGQMTNINEAFNAYEYLFSFLMYVSVTLGIILLLFSKVLRKHMHGIH